jgi:hypothetical protein
MPSAEQIASANKLVRANISWMVQTVGKTGKAMLVPHIDARVVYDVLDELYPGSWSTEGRGPYSVQVGSRTRVAFIGRITVRESDGLERTFEDVGVMDDDVKNETKDRSEIVVKGTWSAAIKRASVPVSRVFRQLYDFEPLYLQCEPDGNSGWLQPKAWEIDRYVQAELARRGINLQAEIKPVGKMNPPPEDEREEAGIRFPAGKNVNGVRVNVDDWSEFWKTLASQPNGAALRKKGIDIRNASPGISVADLRAKLNGALHSTG